MTNKTIASSHTHIDPQIHTYIRKQSTHLTTTTKAISSIGIIDKIPRIVTITALRYRNSIWDLNMFFLFFFPILCYDLSARNTEREKERRRESEEEKNKWKQNVK